MTTIWISLIVAIITGILCFIVEKSDKIHLHIDRHHDSILAALTGSVTAFFVSLILIMITRL
jgi:hypothetical protein